MKDNMKKCFLMALAWVMMWSFSFVAQAEEVYYINGDDIYNKTDYALKDGKTTITWVKVSDNCYYDVELADNKEFRNAQQYSTNKTELTIDKSAFGKNGGRFYVRIRVAMQPADENGNIYESDWSTPAEMTIVKINKANFPGMYQVIKNGGKDVNVLTGKVEKIIFDKNKDGWLDMIELRDAYKITTVDIMKKVNGKYKLTKATSISSFEGVEYFPNLYCIQVTRFSGKKVDLSKCNAKDIEIHRHTSKQLTVIAPNATRISISEPLKDNTQIDLSKCSSVVELGVVADNTKGTKVLKLPKEKKKLKILILAKIQLKSIDMNSYKNLQQLYLYRCDAKSVKVNKCKDLRYIYICQCEKIKSLNLKSNKKLRGADFYQSPGLTKKTVKKSKSGKYTWNKGRWWEETAAYKKDMEQFH